MKYKKQNTFFNSSFLILLFFISPLLIAQNQISVSVLSNGGEKQFSTNYVLEGTAGQIGADLITSSGYQVLLGFWNMYNQNITVNIENEEAVPTVFKLEQNYPNPFNPSTNIRFRIADFGYVSLNVYDVLGNEVVTLVDEYKTAGRYEIEFDASSLSSEIYFYHLKAGDFIKLKKC